MTQATDGHAAGVSYQHGVVQDHRVEVALIHGGEFGILEAGLAAELRSVGQRPEEVEGTTPVLSRYRDSGGTSSSSRSDTRVMLETSRPGRKKTVASPPAVGGPLGAGLLVSISRPGGGPGSS
jgi:hypothetical protein